MWEGSAGGYKGLLSSQPVWGRNGGRKDRLLPAPASRARCAPARSEVQKAVNTARGLYQRWCELLQESAVVGREELDWTTNELRNGLRSIEWDLEDLEETIGIVEANPGKFKLPAGDLQERKVFVQRMRESVQEMKDHMVSPAAIAFMERNNREMLTGKPAILKSSSDLLDASVVSTTSRYIEEQQATQQLILDQQDQQLEMVSGSISVLKHMSGRVGEELDEQGIMLDAFAQEMDHTQSRMDGVLRKMAKISHMTSGRFLTTEPLGEPETLQTACYTTSVSGPGWTQLGHVCGLCGADAGHLGALEN
ncbi:syntaxin-10 isoform X1 [Bos javanicus]|uniref:syntaxin-10 isoform X1 n=1 Tax=Bos javanicus TaxID=9906 RepID=UPI002AA7D3E5|nr:syntaxin-10 isoform X1 [Bos javanicus]